MTMIEIRGLVKEFNIDSKIFRAIDNVNLDIPRASVYGIIGLSGAGKSTLIRCINGLEVPTEGKIVIDGINISSLNEKQLLEQRRNIGMIFQSFNLFYQKNVFDNIAYPLKISNVPKKQIEDRVKQLLKFVDLEEKRNAYPDELSGGQKQRVAIARALATNPKILLSDEGTSALDPANTTQILKILRKAVDEFGMTVVMITHQMEVAKEICDRVAVMEKGKVIEENDVQSIFTNPKTLLTRTFVDSLTLNNEDNSKIDLSKFKGQILRIAYNNDTTDRPILSQCIKNFSIDINLISGNINNLNNGRVGYMYIEMLGDDNEIKKAKSFLKENGIVLEDVNE